MFLSESLGKHVLHKVVYLIDTVELLQLLPIYRLLLGDLRKVPEPQAPNVLVLHDIVELPLLPAILNVPIHFVLGPLLELLLVLEPIGVVAVFPELGLLFLEVGSLGEHV